MENLLESISNEIADKVRAKIDLKTIFHIKPVENAINLIEQAISCLEKWQKQYLQTRQEIEVEGSGVKRWDFNGNRLFSKIRYMKNILDDIKKACKVLREFYTLLGNDLKAVTGSSEQIDSVFDKVREYVGKLESFPNDVFKEEYKDAWVALFQGFEHNIETIENETISLIDMTFRDKLKSAEGAFDLLQKFKNIMTRPRIEEKMKNKYDDVLNQYDKELDNMRELFEKGMKNTPISKNRPPKAGKICWARSIMGRIRAPIFKFKTYENLLQKDNGKLVSKKYVALARDLDRNYEAQIYEKWQRDNTEYAISLLKNKILTKIEDGENRSYEVNFAPDLKVIIREAKYLDRIGKDIP